MVSQQSEMSENRAKSADLKVPDQGDGGIVHVDRSVLDKVGRVYATGKRKTAVARVWLKPSNRGLFLVNGRPCGEVFPGERFLGILNAPFACTNRMGLYDVVCTSSGGGVSAQAEAVRHGISVALQKYEPGLRPVLKSLGLLTRDSRRVERKKPGLRKARRAPQFSKR